jgi:hypothetical protein
VTVAFWTTQVQTFINRRATDNPFIAGQRAIYSRPDFIVSRQFPSNQFTARRAIVWINHSRCASLFSLKRTSANSQF